MKSYFQRGQLLFWRTRHRPTTPPSDFHFLSIVIELPLAAYTRLPLVRLKLSTHARTRWSVHRVITFSFSIITQTRELARAHTLTQTYTVKLRVIHYGCYFSFRSGHTCIKCHTITTMNDYGRISYAYHTDSSGVDRRIHPPNYSANCYLLRGAIEFNLNNPQSIHFLLLFVTTTLCYCNTHVLL